MESEELEELEDILNEISNDLHKLIDKYHGQSTGHVIALFQIMQNTADKNLNEIYNNLDKYNQKKMQTLRNLIIVSGDFKKTD